MVSSGVRNVLESRRSATITSVCPSPAATAAARPHANASRRSSGTANSPQQRPNNPGFSARARMPSFALSRRASVCPRLEASRCAWLPARSTSAPNGRPPSSTCPSHTATTTRPRRPYTRSTSAAMRSRLSRRPLILSLRPAPATTAAAAAPATRLRCVLAQAAHVTHAKLRGVGLRCGQQMVVIGVVCAAANEIRLRKILHQRRRLRRDGGRRNHIRIPVVSELLKICGVVNRRQTGCGKISAALQIRGHSCVVVLRSRLPRAAQREENRILAAWLGQARNVGRAHERQSEAIGSGCRLLLRLAAQRKRLSVQSRVAAHPEDGSMRLARIEAAEVAAPTAAAATAPSAAEATTSTTKSSAAPEATTSTETSTAAKSAAPAAPATPEQAACSGKTLSGIRRLICRDRVPDLLDVHARHRTHLPRLTADRYRICAEVGVAGH